MSEADIEVRFVSILGSLRERLRGATLTVQRLLEQSPDEHDTVSDANVAMLHRLDEQLAEWAGRLSELDAGLADTTQQAPEQRGAPRQAERAKPPPKRSSTRVENVAEAVRRSSRKKKKNAPPPEPEEDEEEGSVEDGEQVEKVKVAGKKTVLKNVHKRVREVHQIRDGMAGRTQDGGLVYFTLLNEVPASGKGQKKRQKMWSCPTTTFGVSQDDAEADLKNVPGALVVARTGLDQLQFSSLSQRERAWYLQHLLTDLIRRCQANVPVLFENAGADMLNARQMLTQEHTDESLSILEALRLKVAYRIISDLKLPSSLSAANNTVLMVAAKIYSRLWSSGDVDWHERYLERTKELAQVCTLKPDTIARYRTVGELMLQSPLIACLLPGFVAPLLEPITALLEDDEVVDRLDAAFAAVVPNGLPQLAGAPPNVERLLNQPPDLLPLPELPRRRVREPPVLATAPPGLRRER